jgi:hypothetical protein
MGTESPVNTDRARREAWAQYWATGALHSCIGSYDGNYQGAIGALWDAFGKRLRAGMRVLDLATGNGALPRRLWEHAAQVGALEIDAIDLAQVAPDWYRPTEHAGVRFHSGVDMCDLPFPDARYDWVVSQFGFEYAPRERALREIVRVAHAQGGICLVMHHSESVFASVARADLEHQARLLGQDGLLDAAESVLGWVARARSGEQVAGDAQAEAARAVYNAAMRELGAAIAASAVPDQLVSARDTIHALLAHRDIAPSDAVRALRAYRTGLELASLRTRELIAHALDGDDMDALASQVRALRPGWSVRRATLRQEEGLLAWAFVAGPAAEGWSFSPVGS